MKRQLNVMANYAPEGEAYPTLTSLIRERDGDPRTIVSERESFDPSGERMWPPQERGRLVPHVKPNPIYGKRFSWGKAPQKEATK